MMYPYMTLNDDTEITHSEMKQDGRVKVYIETPDEQVCFRYATCWLPEYRWEDIFAYYRVFAGRWYYKCLKFLELVRMQFIFGLICVIIIPEFQTRC